MRMKMTDGSRVFIEAPGALHGSPTAAELYRRPALRGTVVPLPGPHWGRQLTTTSHDVEGPRTFDSEGTCLGLP